MSVFKPETNTEGFLSRNELMDLLRLNQKDIERELSRDKENMPLNSSLETENVSLLKVILENNTFL